MDLLRKRPKDFEFVARQCLSLLGQCGTAVGIDAMPRMDIGPEPYRT